MEDRWDAQPMIDALDDADRALNDAQIEALNIQPGDMLRSIRLCRHLLSTIVQARTEVAKAAELFAKFIGDS